MLSRINPVQYESMKPVGPKGPSLPKVNSDPYVSNVYRCVLLTFFNCWFIALAA